MTVAELIEKLKQMPQDLPVMLWWDGGTRSSAEKVKIFDEFDGEPKCVAIGDEYDF